MPNDPEKEPEPTGGGEPSKEPAPTKEPAKEPAKEPSKEPEPSGDLNDRLSKIEQGFAELPDKINEGIHGVLDERLRVTGGGSGGEPSGGGEPAKEPEPEPSKEPAKEDEPPHKEGIKDLAKKWGF